MEALLEALSKNARARLRWRVMRELGITPGSRQARKISDLDCIVYGLHMLLDMRKGGIAAAGRQKNPAFDESRFEALRGGSLN